MNFGFIVLRHVNSELTNQYWNQCVKLLRSFYPENQIVIIDDNSNQNLVKSDFDYKNVTIIQSEYHGRGELLPYIYFYKYKWFDNAVFIHDSVFFHKTINFDKIIQNNNNKVVSLWYFGNNDSELEHVLDIANNLNHSEIIKQKLLEWNKNTWRSCFGVMSLINHNFLNEIVEKYNLFNLIDVIKNRSDRCALERIIGVIFYIETNNTKTIFGDISKIHQRSNDSYSYNHYIESFYKKKLPSYFIKVWTGR
jgi:hypothetical protein